jgi:hypothetical protein
MTEDEKKKLEEELNIFYEQSKMEGGDLENPESLMGSPELFGVDGDMEELNYKEEMEITFYESKEVLENMATMYLDNKEELLSNKYIKNKVLNDAQNLSDMMFLQKIAKRAIVKQMQQIEMGDGTPRHYETLSIMMREIRENIKQSTLTVSTMEGFYLKIRNEMGMGNEIKSIESSVEENKTEITTVNNINDKLEELLKRRSSDNDNNQKS